MNTLIMMCGLPASGKSTYGKKLIELHPDWEYVSRDEVRYEYVTDKAHYFDHEKEVYREFCNRLEMHLINGKTVIADATHLSKNSRKYLMHNLGVKPDQVIVIVMETPLSICLARNAKRTKDLTRVPDQTMYAMSNRFVKPDARFEDFIDKVFHVKGA